MNATPFIECEKMNCYKCDVYIEGTISSRFFTSKFQKDECWTRNNFPRPSWEYETVLQSKECDELPDRRYNKSMVFFIFSKGQVRNYLTGN